MECSLFTSLISPNLISDWLQPWQTGSCNVKAEATQFTWMTNHNALSSVEMRSTVMRLGETSNLKNDCIQRSMGHPLHLVQ